MGGIEVSMEWHNTRTASMQEATIQNASAAVTKTLKTTTTSTTAKADSKLNDINHQLTFNSETEP